MGAPRTRRCGHAATRRLDSGTATVHGRAGIDLRRAAVDALNTSRCTRLRRSDVGSELRCSVPPRSRACADRPPRMFLGACGSAVSAACMSALRGCMGCMCATSARCAPAAADGARCHVERAHLARHDGRVSIGLGRRDVREHRRHAGEPRHQRCVWYLYTIESVPFIKHTQVFFKTQNTVTHDSQ